MNAKHCKNRSVRRGQTLVEMVVALGLTAVVCIVGLSTFLVGVGAWYRGQARIDSEVPSEHAVREIAMQLRSAMSVTVASNGMSLTYRLPAENGSGTFIQPATWDGVTRTIGLSDGTLSIATGNSTPVPICKNVITTDPLSPGGTGGYVLFTPGPGTITRSITIMVVSQQSAYNDPKPVFGRHRETIYLRNVPQLSQ